MVFRPATQPPVSQGQYWDSRDYADPVRMEHIYGGRRQRLHQVLVERVGQLVHPGRWLDIGCGPGHLLREAVTAGWTACGIDLSGRAVAEARRFGLEVVCGTFPVDMPEGSYDVISILHTLEYIPDPKPLLRSCSVRLRPDGVLLLQLKNFSFWTYAERFYRAKSGIWCPQDIRSYSPGTIRALLRMADFAETQVWPAELPDRPVANTCFGLLAALRGPLLSPNMTVIARSNTPARIM